MQTPDHDAIVTIGGPLSKHIADEQAILIERIDGVLPQTQCRQCGYAGCKPYAVAIAQGEARINQCPPGGEAGIHALAEVINVPYLPLNTAHGVTKPRAVAVIDEQRCIGCTLCIKACPVDAILGASKQMHTVISQECTGCELCLAPCPVDCIVMQPVHPGNALAETARTQAVANLARMRYQNRQARLVAGQQENTPSPRKQSSPSPASSLSGGVAQSDSHAEAIRKAAIAAAMARVKAQKTSGANRADPGS